MPCTPTPIARSTAAEVITELVELAKQLKFEHDRGAQLGLRDDELAFYDAVCQNDSAVMELGDDILKAIAQELVDGGTAPMRPSTGTRRNRSGRHCAATSGGCSPSTVLLGFPWVISLPIASDPSGARR